ncbi:MAG: hypothetical protein JWQ02_2692 [Capsulimonas sp.]|nr:hypothetical protein [Capsulimonas sp.]
MSENFTKWFLRIWLTAGIISAIAWLWNHFPLCLLMMAVTALLIRRAILKERWRRQKDGYRLEFLGPGVLRGDNDEFAVVYHEGDKQKVFCGKNRETQAGYGASSAGVAAAPKGQRARYYDPSTILTQRLDRTWVTCSDFAP